ncbi:MAG: hypothetical protein R6V23_00375 [Bacteroidales bacterium]
MMSYKFLRIIKFAALILFITIFSSCNKSPEKDKTRTSNIREIDTSAVLIKYNNTLFTLPSPYQATYTIKKGNLDFNKSLLNPADHVSSYTTNFEKALNIGIYGTDLGYLNIYDQVPDVISYFTVIKKLSQELGIQSALQIEIIERIENNIDDQDSLLHFLTNTYKQFDKYLKANNRKEIGALIIAGGWIESLYILSQNALENKNRQIINRLGEQKHPLDNLIEILSPFYYQSDEFTNLINELVDLAYEFDGIIYNYTYEPPVIYPEKKLTEIKSTSNIIISEYHLRTIANKISSIRNKIIY